MSATASTSVLVAGVGNLFRGDDGFGGEVVRHLLGLPLPPGVVARDFGTSALDLRFWMERHDVVVVVDAMARGRAPGTLVVLEPADVAPSPAVAPAHGLTATDVVTWAAARSARGERPRLVRVVGCEPATLGDEDDGALGLSPAVAAVVPAAADLVRELIDELGAQCTSSG